MGDYYSFRMRGFLHAEGERLWHVLRQDHDWVAVADRAKTPEERAALLEYALHPRSRHVPFGGLQFAPRGWSEGFDQPAELAARHRSTSVSFCCSVKEFEVIKQFVTRIVPLLFRKVETCQSIFEYEDHVTTWLFDEQWCVVAAAQPYKRENS